MPIRPVRWSRQAIRNISASGVHRGRSCVGAIAIIGQEDLLEVGLVAAEVDDLGAGERMHQRPKTPSDDTTKVVVCLLDAINSRRRLDGSERHLARNFDLHLVESNLME